MDGDLNMYGTLARSSALWPTIPERVVVREQETTGEWQRAAVERVICVMRQRLDDPLTLDEMAEVAHLSRFHFNRVFSSVTGVSPRKFLATLRLEYAKRLLLTTEMSITEVCFETGYSSLGTFTTHFTTLVGVTPSKWRRLSADLDLPMEQVVEMVVGAQRRRDNSPHAVVGNISIPAAADGFNGVVFVGLFERQIPQSLPAQGDLLFGAGDYRIPTVPDGNYYALAAAIPWPLNIMDFFLPDMMLRDGSDRISVRDGACDKSVDLVLREPRITDPPILLALPYVFAAYLEIGGMSLSMPS